MTNQTPPKLEELMREFNDDCVETDYKLGGERIADEVSPDMIRDIIKKVYEAGYKDGEESKYSFISGKGLEDDDIVETEL